jgi:hypothetical protein
MHGSNVVWAGFETWAALTSHHIRRMLSKGMTASGAPRRPGNVSVPLRLEMVR